MRGAPARHHGVTALPSVAVVIAAWRDAGGVCTAGDVRCPGLATNEVRLVLGGPNGDAVTPDLSLSVSYGRYDVRMG